jgi:hypothetical protein
METENTLTSLVERLYIGVRANPAAILASTKACSSSRITGIIGGKCAASRPVVSFSDRRRIP